MKKFFEYKPMNWKCFIPNNISPTLDPVVYIGMEIGYEEIFFYWKSTEEITYYLK